MEKSFASCRGLLFEPKVICIFSTGATETYPLAELRSNLSTEEKYAYVMGLNSEEVKSRFLQHEEFYEKSCPQ